MSELAKLKQLHAVSVSSSSPAAAAGTATGAGEQSSSGGQMMMMQQMVNTGVDPFLGQSVVAGPAAPAIESRPAQRSSDTGLGQYTYSTALQCVSLTLVYLSLCVCVCMYVSVPGAYLEPLDQWAGNFLC